MSRASEVPVSCYIRTLNEERKLGEVIAAVRDLVSEVVVVDSGSTDATVAIAEGLGARVIHQAWLGNGRQKRFAEDQCRNDYLLDLDADEVVSPALAEEIRALFANGGPPPLPVYELELVTVPPTGKPWHGFWLGAGTSSTTARSYARPTTRPGTSSRCRPACRSGGCPAPLFHHSFRDLAHLVAKLSRTSSVRATETRSALAAGGGLRVLFAFPFYFAEALPAAGPVPGRHLRLRARQHPRLRPLAARRQDVRGDSAAPGAGRRAPACRPSLRDGCQASGRCDARWTRAWSSSGDRRGTTQRSGRCLPRSACEARSRSTRARRSTSA